MNTGASRVTPSITTAIRIDHSHILALFHRFKANTSPDRGRALVGNACLALSIHSQLEEEIFYPAMRRISHGDELLERSGPVHEEIRELIAGLRQVLAQDQIRASEDLYGKFFALMRLVINHVADEEARLLPLAAQLPADVLCQLGMQMIERRVELMKPHAAEFASYTVRSFPTAAAAGVALLTAGVLALGALAQSRQNQ